MSIVEDLIRSMSRGDGLTKLGGQVGIDGKTAAMGLAAALPMILGALRRNAATPEGARALESALARDHDGGLLDDLGGFLDRGDASDGEAILGHVFGPRRDAALDGMGRSIGLDPAAASKLMAMAAPMVLAQLGRMRRERGMNAEALAGYLNEEGRTLERAAPAQMSALNRVLDADGDGEIEMSDLASRGGALMDSINSILGGRN